jgi:hypothetical protein
LYLVFSGPLPLLTHTPIPTAVPCLCSHTRPFLHQENLKLNL